MQIKFLPLIFLGLNAFASSSDEEPNAVQAVSPATVSQELESICKTLGETFGRTRAAPVTTGNLDELGVPNHQDLRHFFLTCNTLKWRHWDFVNVKRPVLWTYIKTHGLLGGKLFPICHIADSDGKVCLHLEKGTMVDFFPRGRGPCGTHGHAHDPHNKAPHQAREEETFTEYLERYLAKIESSKGPLG